MFDMEAYMSLAPTPTMSNGSNVFTIPFIKTIAFVEVTLVIQPLIAYEM
tara:strand:- start:955 stop:1101 length:147 start_codon:yes stop_codon:yes gene_type:complete